MAHADKDPATAEAWAAFRNWMAWAHPRGAQVVDRAKAAGCNLKDCISIAIDRPANLIGGWPVACFGEWDSEYLIVQPDTVGRFRREPRGAGPEIDLAELNIGDKRPKR